MRKTLALLLATAFVASLPTIASAKSKRHHRHHRVVAVQPVDSNIAGPRLVGGDFNSWWGEWWIGQMDTEYSDTWVDYSKQKDGAYTTNGVRFDYIFRSFDGGWRLTPTNAFVASTSLSDHRPFVADFKVQ